MTATLRITHTSMPASITVSPDVLRVFQDFVQFDNAEWALVDNLVAAREGLPWVSGHEAWRKGSWLGQSRLNLPPIQMYLPLED